MPLAPNPNKPPITTTTPPARQKIPLYQNPIGTHAIKTRSPYTLIKTPSEPTRSPSVNQNPIWTHPKSKPTSPNQSPHTTSHNPHAPWWTPCKTAQATPVASLEQEREWVHSHIERELKWECWERVKREC